MVDDPVDDRGGRRRVEEDLGPARERHHPEQLARELRAHFSRASARLTCGQKPSPRLRWRPSMLKRCAQDFAKCPRAVCLTRSDSPPEPRPSP